jgi:hypothetical protein
MTEGMRLLRLRKQLEAGVEDDDKMYEMMKEYAGEEAAAEALYQRKKARRDSKQKAN